MGELRSSPNINFCFSMRWMFCQRLTRAQSFVALEYCIVLIVLIIM